MGRKKRDNKQISSSEEDDDDEEDDEDEDKDDDSESEDSDESTQQKRQTKKRQTNKMMSRKQTFVQKVNYDQQQKKKTIINEREDSLKQSQQRKPTNFNRSRRIQDEDEQSKQNITNDFNTYDEEDDFGLDQRKFERKKGPQKTIINSQNLFDLKNKAKQLNQQNLLIENLEQKLEEKHKEARILNLEQQQDIQQKEKNIQTLNNEKQELEMKVGKQTSYLKKIKEKLNIRKGSILNLQLERRNSNDTEQFNTSSNALQTVTESIVSQTQIVKKPQSILTKLVSYLQYNYPLSNRVHRILNFYTKNEELHFTYISVYLNLSLIFLILFSPFILLQVIENYNNFETSKPLSFLMYHEYKNSYITVITVIFVVFIIINMFVLFYKISYVRKKEVESEAQSSKDLNNFKLVFSSVNFRLSNYEFMKKQQIALKDRILLSWKLTDNYESKRIGYGNWIYLLRCILIIFQIGMIIGLCYVFSFINSLDLFSSSSSPSLILKMPIIYSFVIVIATSFVSQICYYLTKFEVWDSHSKSFKMRIWKYYFIQILSIYYGCLLKTSISFKGKGIAFIGLDDQFQLLSEEFYCSSEQMTYAFISIYFAQFIWSLISMVLPNLFAFLIKRKSKDSAEMFLKNQTPFRVLEETIPIIILNMIGYMIVPLFPLIILINLIVHGLIFLYSWKVIISYKYQYYSSVSRQYIMNILVKFFVISFLLTFIYYVIMSYKDQSSYFVGGDYTKNNIQRVCGPLLYNQSIAESIQTKVNSIQYVRQFFELISWQPLLWVVIVYLFSLSRLETKTKNVWRNEYFTKSREMQTVKNYFQSQAQKYEEKIKFAQKELSNIDTPKPKANNPKTFFDSPPQSIAKSKFSTTENNNNQQKQQKNNNISNGQVSNFIGYNGNLISNLQDSIISSPQQSQFGMDDSKLFLISRQNFSHNSQKSPSLQLNNSNSHNFSRFKLN